MARFPCSLGPHRNVGRNYTLYFHLYGGGLNEDSRIRLCGEHIALAQDDLAQFEIDPDSGAMRNLGSDANCLTCGKPVDERGWQVSVTSYEPNNQCKDYGASLHTDCRLPVWATCGVPT